MLERCLAWVCQKVADRCDYRVIPRPDGEPYLVRYYLLGHREVDEERRPFNIYLHLFFSGDVEPELHSHPWKTSFSVILTGGYQEERKLGARVVTRLVKPLSINVIRADDFHRIDLLKDEAWTVFFAGEPLTTWHFWDRITNETVWWRDHISGRPQRQSVDA